jgi:hypothetical protein
MAGLHDELDNQMCACHAGPMVDWSGTNSRAVSLRHEPPAVGADHPDLPANRERGRPVPPQRAGHRAGDAGNDKGARDGGENRLFTANGDWRYDNHFAPVFEVMFT